MTFVYEMSRSGTSQPRFGKLLKNSQRPSSRKNVPQLNELFSYATDLGVEYAILRNRRLDP